MIVCGAKCHSMDTAVFCSICDNYGIYGGIVGLQCISNLFLVIFTPFRGFSAKFECFGWNMTFGLGRSGFHGCFDDSNLDLNFGLIILFFGAFGSPGRCHAKSAGEKICR